MLKLQNIRKNKDFDRIAHNVYIVILREIIVRECDYGEEAEENKKNYS